MIRRLLVPTLVLLASFVLTPALRAETNGYSLISPEVANRYGLERRWFTQVRLAPGSEGIVDLSLHVSPKQAQTLFRIMTSQGRTYSISERNLDTFGQPMGVDGAAKAAAEKVRLLRLEGIDATVEQAVVPDITLYITTDSGMVHAIDAETGRTHWMTPVGSMDYPTTKPAVTEQHVALINGQSLFILDTKEGTILEHRRIIGGPGAGPAIVGNIVFVPLLNGRVNAFTFGPKASWWPSTYHSRGSVAFQPTATAGHVAWANDAGDISVIEPGKRGVRYRLRLTDAIAGPLIALPPKQILGVTQTGYVYSFDITTGRLIWRYSSGDVTSEPAATVGEMVFLMTRDHGMHTISAATGERIWPTPYAPATKFIAATAERVYCTINTGQIVALDIATGHEVGRIPLSLNDRVFANSQTDRMYIATQSGTIQCLHELGADLPIIHVSDKPEETAAPGGAETQGEGDAGTEPADPFAKPPADAGMDAPGGDPFDEDGKKVEAKPGADADPFRGR